jgi:signal transduction histidine kinase
VIGTLTVFDKVQTEALGDDGFTDDDLRFLTVLAGQAAIAIENAKLFDGLKQQQQRNRELHTHLLRSERLAALGELSSQVAHEIRNPLTAIGGFARSIERNMSSEDADRGSIEVIIRETERLERILTEQLTFAKLSPPEFEPGDINKIVTETVDLFGEKSEAKSARLVTDLADDIPAVNVDADKMKQVFINLLQNAIDTIVEGGTISIRTNRLDRTVEIRFANDGPPITDEMLDRLFVPFATTKSGGSGLGLPIAYEIVYEHGGTIDVTSEEGQGTVFLITLPLALEGERRQGPIDRRSAMRDRRRFGRVP